MSKKELLDTISYEYFGLDYKHLDKTDKAFVRKKMKE